MSTELANKLMGAESAEAFLRDLGVASTWETVASIKSEVDRLVGADLNAASRLTERVEQLAVILGDPVSKAFAEASRARVLHNSGRHAEASVLYDSALGGMRAAKLVREGAAIQTHQVYALTQMGRYDEARRTASLARRVLARGEARQLAQLETNIGTIYYRQDRYKRALDHYDRARELLAHNGDDATRAFIDFSRSNILTETDQPEEALALLESAAAAWDGSELTLLAAQARSHIAYIQFLRGNYHTALTTYYHVRDQMTELGSPMLAAWCSQEIAEILLALNAFDDAAEGAAAAKAAFAELGMPYESAQATMVRALAAMGLRQFEEARSDLISAREVFARSGNKPLAAMVDAYLAEVALRNDQAAEAQQRASSAFRVFVGHKVATRKAYTRLLQARAAYRIDDRAMAARMAKAALRAVEGAFAPAVVYQCQHLLGRIERDRNRARPALDFFRRSIETVEQMRGGIVADEFKASFLRDKIEAYEDAISACLSEGTEALVEEAFRLVESSKSRALADLLARYVRASADDTPGPQSETRTRLAKLIEELSWYSSQAGLEDDKGDQRSAESAGRYRQALARCERQIAQLFRRLDDQHSAISEMQRMPAASVDDLRSALEPGETLIEYFTTGEHVSAFIASGNEISVAKGIASKSHVERVLAALRFQIEKFNYGAGYAEAYFGQLKRAANEHLTELYKTIFLPIEGMLDSVRLIIVPHGALHYVPFHALYDGSSYLVDRYEMSYSPSAAVLKLCRERAKFLHSKSAGRGGSSHGDKDAVSTSGSHISNVKSQISNFKSGVLKSGAQSGDLKSEISNLKSKVSYEPRRNAGDVRSDTLVALGVAESGTPNIEDEIRTLASLFPNAVKLTGNEATRDNLMKVAPIARFLHLATHGYFRRDNPMFSFLKLADSQLNFYSLLDLKLNAEMVTLSACQTGVNMVFPGDELHGLMRGFLYAGAPSLVASLWAVSDRSTSEFMREMYSQIRSGASKRLALRQAQLSIKDHYGHPYYWAPFVLMGDPG